MCRLPARTGRRRRFMVEPIMFFGLGFLAASLLGLIIVPFVHGRAVRLTGRRLEAATPLSMTEIQADKDQLRAEFAMSTRQVADRGASKPQGDNLKDQAAGLGKDLRETEERHPREKEAAAKATQELTEERGTVGKLALRVSDLERQLATQTTEAEIMSRRVADLELRLAEQARVLTDRERERDQLRTDLDASRRIETDLRQELATIERRHDTATEALRGEKVLAESQLERTREDRAKLQNELAAMKREAEATWASERVENALLRERINDVAAEVARLTAVLEGPGSTIDTILASAPEPAVAAVNGAPKPVANGEPANANGEGNKGSLADRIRALQARSSRLSSAT